MASKETEEIRFKKSCFPSCFGSPRNVSDGNTKKMTGDRHVVSGRKRHWLSWVKFRMRKSGTRTMPVDEKMTHGQIASVGIEDEIQEIHECETMERNPAVHVIPVLNQGLVGKGRKAKYGNGKLRQDAQISNPESRKDQDLFVSSKTDRFLTGLPQTNPGRPVVTPSSSPLKRHKPARSGRIPTRSGRKPVAGKFESVVGISVLVVTLAVMLVWGRICAIICTSAWFYVVSRLRTVPDSGEIALKRPESSIPDIDSEQYKKKVILEGLLERNHKCPAPIL